jgi:hypothetical protein
MSLPPFFYSLVPNTSVLWTSLENHTDAAFDNSE